MMTTTPIEVSKKKLWLAAIKPPMYSVAIIPITTGTAVAFMETGTLNWNIFLTFLSAAIGIIAWLNLSNDVFDSETGIDKNKAHSVVNLTGNKSLIFWLSNTFLLVSLAGIVSISWQQQDLMVLGLIFAACALGYTYQGPPFRLGYQGLGEFICFFTFGPMAVEAAYYSQTQSFSINALAASVIIGITTSIILFCSHFHQVEDDLAAGKRSPIVRLGTALGAKVLTIATASVFVITVPLIYFDYFPVSTALIYISVPIAYQLVNHVHQYHDQPEKVSNSKFIAVRVHFFSGVLLGIGLVL